MVYINLQENGQKDWKMINIDKLVFQQLFNKTETGFIELWGGLK